jgi:hypothetical protein
MAHIFISFIHEEEEYATCVQRFLEETLGGDFKPFLSSDKWQVHAGELWLDRIVSELREAKVVISMLSPESVKRPWINFEAGAAFMSATCTLIPVCFNGLTKDGLPKPYSSIQAVDLSTGNVDDQYYLVQSVAHYLGLPTPPSPIFTKEEIETRKRLDIGRKKPFAALNRCFTEADQLKAVDKFMEESGA